MITSETSIDQQWFLQESDSLRTEDMLTITVFMTIEAMKNLYYRLVRELIMC